MSELYGRLPVYHVNTFLFLVFNVGCGRSTSLSMLIVFRFLAGVAGSCPLTVGSGSIADTFRQDQRGKVMSVWTFPILFGPRCVYPGSTSELKPRATNNRVVLGLWSVHTSLTRLDGSGISISSQFG